ncbi:zinc C2H2-like protein [Schistosoma japonicum]|nr:zinc C2H2-like protein [Schistosoma japonicum]KAH8863502.1 zinc C2H2-like protein [Schistosoma japonicum]
MTSNNSKRLILPKTHSSLAVANPKKCTTETDLPSKNVPSVSSSSSSVSSFRTIAPRINPSHTVVATPEVSGSNEFGEKDVVHYGDIESGNQDFNPLRTYRAIYANNVVPRSYLRVNHRRVLLPSHTIPRTPIDTDKLPSGPCQSGFGVNSEGSLRPTVNFLVRIGSALVRSQYESAVGKESTPRQSLANNRRKRKRVDEQPTRSYSDKINIETVNISHLEWKQKVRHSRWEDIWDYCHQCRCPYVPTSALQLLRHLEQGHQKLINIDSVTLPRKTRPEKVDCPDCKLNPAETLANKLISRFYVPLTVNISDPSSSISSSTCYVCGEMNKSQCSLDKHFQRMHPQLTPGRIEKSKCILCSICGLPTQSALFRNSHHMQHSDISLHVSCKSNQSVHNNSPWSGCDAHALACLMLYPTLYAQFGLPFHVARFLYTLIQHMLAARIKQFGGWSVQSFTLRCCAAISAIYGELVDPNQVKPFIHSKMRILEDSNCTSSSSLKSLFSKTSTTLTSLFHNSASNQLNTYNSKGVIPVSLPTILVSSSLPIQSCFTSTSPSSSSVNLTSVLPTLSLPVNSISDLVSKSAITGSVLPSILFSQPTPTIGQKRSLPLESALPVCVTVTKQPNLPIHGSAQISNTPWSPNVASGTTVLPLFPNQSKIPINPKPVIPVSMNLTSDNLFHPQQSSFNGDKNTVHVQIGPNGQIKRSLGSQPRSLPRVLPMSEIPCELCLINIPTETNAQRFHLMYQHKVKCLRHVPSYPCCFCGQLFWTNAGLSVHQSGSCILCKESTLCNSTYYVHGIIKHPQQFAYLLTQGVYDCSRCCRAFTDMISYMVHMQTIHFFTVPDDVNALRKYDPTKNQFDYDKVTINPKLSNLATLYSSLSMSTSVSYSLPDNIAIHVKTNKSPYWKCSVCSTHFLTTSHLDLHMAQAGHQYWCPLCPYACERAISLWKHYCSCHNNELEPGRPLGTSRLYRIVKHQSIITTKYSSASPVITTTASISPSGTVTKAKIITSPSKQANQRRAIGHLSQFHGCDLCPVFCLTVDDLNTHKKTAHAIELTKDNAKPFVTATSTTTNTTTTAIITSALSSQPIQLTISANSSSSKPIRDGNTNVDQSDFNPSGSRLNINLSDNTIDGEQSETLSVNPKSNNANNLVIDQIAIDDDVADDNDLGKEVIGADGCDNNSNNDNDDEGDVICPMCEFHSKLRSDVMQHIMDFH